KINKTSNMIIKDRKEKRDEFVNRLTYSKRIKEMKKPIIALTEVAERKPINMLASYNTFRKCNKKSPKKNETLGSGRILTTSVETRVARNTESDDKKTYRDLRQEKEILKDLNYFRVDNENKKQLFEKSYHNNLQKYK